MMDCDRRKFTMLASSLGSGENKNDSGIVSGHAYSIIAVKEVTLNGEKRRIV